MQPADVHRCTDFSRQHEYVLPAESPPDCPCQIGHAIYANETKISYTLSHWPHIIHLHLFDNIGLAKLFLGHLERSWFRLFSSKINNFLFKFHSNCLDRATLFWFRIRLKWWSVKRLQHNLSFYVTHRIRCRDEEMSVNVCYAAHMMQSVDNQFRFTTYWTATSAVSCFPN